MLDAIKKDFRWITLLLIPIGAVVNGGGGWVIAKLNVPFYFDSIGTIFVAVVAGPFAGALTGLITNIILGFVSESYAPYWSVPLLIGLVAGLFANAGWFKQLWKVIMAGVAIALVAATASTLVAMQVFGEITLKPAYFLIEEPADKITAVLIVYFILQFLPASVLSLLPRPENIKPAEK